MALLGHLTPLHGGDSIPLTDRMLTVGRADNCDVVIPHRSVSSVHCRLVWRDGTWIVEDLDSHNGTFIGRTQIKRVRVKSGVTLRIGAVRFELTAAPAQSSASAAPVDEDLAMELLGGATAQSSRPDAATDQQKHRIAEAPRQPLAQTTQRQVVTADAAAGQLPARKPARPVKRFLGKLTPQAGGDPVPLMDEKILIGRGRDCGIRLKYSTISTHHCQLRFHEGHWSVRDLGSRNGVRINSQPIVEEWLMSGDILAVGKFRFEIDYVPKSTQPPPAFDVAAGKSLLEKAGLTKILEGDDEPAWLKTDQDHEPDQRIDLESM